MPILRITFLLFVAAISSGYRFRCYAFCTDQTAIQNDYIEQRDRCREYAELKSDMPSQGLYQQRLDAKGKKSNLVNLFNECMANNGWNIVQETKPAAAAATPQAATAAASAGAGAAIVSPAAQSKAQEVAQSYEEKATLTRASECMFARHAAANSAIAAARAKACDLECTQRMAAAPEAPRPAACPTDSDPESELSRGGDKGF